MTLPRPLLPALTLALVACASSAPQPAAPAPSRASAPPPANGPAQIAAGEAAPPPSDEAPADLLLSGRVGSLRMSWANTERLLRATGGPPLPLSPDLIFMGLLGPAVADVVDLDQPADIAFFGGEMDRFAVALRVQPRAASRLRETFKLAPRRGLLHVEEVLVEVPDVQGGLPACAFVEDEDDGARAVCASDEELLDKAGLYLARAHARGARGGDVRLDVDFARLLPIVEREQKAEPPKDRAEETGQRMANELLRDVGRVGLVGSWGKNEIEAEVEIGFPEPRAALSRVMVAKPAASAPPPASFLRLPKDASLALYAHSEARALQPLRDLLYGAIDDSLIDDGFDASLVETLTKKAEALFFTGGPLVFAEGMDRAGAESALAAWSKDRSAAKGREGAYRAVRAWTLFGVEEPAERWVNGLEELVKLGEEIDRRHNGGAAANGAAPSKDPAKPGENRERLTIVKGAAPKGLPKGTLHLELRSRPRVKDAPPAHTRHLYVVPDGARTWLGLGENEGEILGHLRATLEGAPARTLASMPELEWTRAMGATAGGFVTVAGANLLFADGESDAELGEIAETVELLGLLPTRGDTVIPWLVTTEDMAPKGTRLRVQAHLPVAAITDIVKIAQP